MFGTSLDTEAKICLLGLIEEEGVLGSTQITVTRCLFQGRKLIARKWQDKNPQTVIEWVKVVKDTIEEKYTYKNIRKIWKQWLGQE